MVSLGHSIGATLEVSPISKQPRGVQSAPPTNEVQREELKMYNHPNSPDYIEQDDDRMAVIMENEIQDVHPEWSEEEVKAEVDRIWEDDDYYYTTDVVGQYGEEVEYEIGNYNKELYEKAGFKGRVDWYDFLIAKQQKLYPNRVNGDNS